MSGSKLHFGEITVLMHWTPPGNWSIYDRNPQHSSQRLFVLLRQRHHMPRCMLRHLKKGIRERRTRALEQDNCANDSEIWRN